MSLLKGQNTIDYTISTNLHYNFMFWLDEGLVECGLFSTIQSAYNSSSDLRELTKTREGVYKFALPRLIWQTGVQTPNGIASRFSGITVDGQFYPNISSNYAVDYHNGYLYFTDSTWSNIVNQYGNNPTVYCSSYDVKNYYVVYSNNDTVRQAVNYISKDWINATFDKFDIKSPIICGGWYDTNIQPYELGGTRLTAATYNLLVISPTAQQRDLVTDIIMRQKDVMPPSIIWSSLYDDNANILYNTTEEFLNNSQRWRKWWIDEIHAVRMEHRIYITEFSIDIKIIGIS